MEVPSHYDLTAHTEPYYRSTYVFVTRADRHLAIRSFDDPALRTLRIGIHMMGDDYANSPAAVALAWLLSKPVITAPIVGASKPNHLEDAVAAIGLQLTDEEIKRLEEPYVPHPVVGFS